MNDIINIKEKFKIDDSHSNVRGIVCAYDENNKLVFTKENMIVKSGRKYLMKNGIKNNSFFKAYLGNNGSPVTPDDDIGSFGENPASSNKQIPGFEDENSDFEGITFNPDGTVEGISSDYLEYYFNGTDDYLRVKNDSSLSSNLLEGETIKVKEKSDPTTIWEWKNGDKILKNGKTIIEWENNNSDFEVFFNNISYKWNPTEKTFKNGERNLVDIEGFNKEVKYPESDSETFLWYGGTAILKKNIKNENDCSGNIICNVLSDSNYFSYKIDENDLCISCLIVFNGNDALPAKTLGLTVVDPDTEEEVLFSRVTFPTYYKSNHQRLTFRYYIYF